jgi:hypothetical protein
MAEKKAKTVRIAGDDDVKEEKTAEPDPDKDKKAPAPDTKEDEDDEDTEEDSEEEKKSENLTANTGKKTDNQTKNAGDGKGGKEQAKPVEESLEEERIQGNLTVLSEAAGGKFGNPREYYARFFFRGQFLAFFPQADPKTIPLFYIKVKYILAIEDFFNTNPTQVYVEFYDGKKECRIVLMISDIKIKDKWIDTMSSLKDELEDIEDRDCEDFGKSEVEMKYNLANEYERRLIRHSASAEISPVQFRQTDRV